MIGVVVPTMLTSPPTASEAARSIAAAATIVSVGVRSFPMALPRVIEPRFVIFFMFVFCFPSCWATDVVLRVPPPYVMCDSASSTRSQNGCQLTHGGRQQGQLIA